MKFFKPFAVTGQVGYAIPTESSTTTFDAASGLLTTTPNPRFLNWGGSLQYSMPYLKSNVQDLGLPAFLNRMVPLVEWNLATQVSNFDGTGTINPGVIYVADKYQLGVEATVPVNRLSVGALPPGSYSVTWHVLSVDTHTTQGSFSFHVGR